MEILCKAVLVETTEKSKLCHLSKKGKEWNDLRYTEVELPIIFDSINYKLYFVNNNSGIVQVGDKYVVELFNIEGYSTGLHVEECKQIDDVWVNNFDVSSTRHINNCFKIEVEQDNIPVDYIIKFVKQYNQGDVKNVLINFDNEDKTNVRIQNI